jgi:hypothetical protein
MNWFFRKAPDRGATNAFARGPAARPCEIKIGYIEQERIEADVTVRDLGRQVFEADECMLLFFVNGVWVITDPLTH